MKTYLKNWNYKRFLQLGVGVYFIWEYFQDPTYFAVFFGLLLIVQATLNIGCFSTRGCNPNINEEKKEKFSENNDLEYEEIE